MSLLSALSQDIPMTEEVHKLELRLSKLVSAGGIKRLLVASALRGEGKSTLAALLAMAFARNSDRRVVVVDFDLRDPQLGTHFAMETTRGLADLLRGECTLAEALHSTPFPRLHVLPAGNIHSNSAHLLATSRLADVFTSLDASFDLVLCDSPALVPVADAATLIPFADGVILVIMAGKSTRTHLSRAREFILGMGGSILGLVVVNAQEAIPDYYTKEHYYYAKTREARRPETPVVPPRVFP